MRRNAGDQFGPFTLVKLIESEGYTGELWSARDRTRANREVAIKIFDHNDALGFHDRELVALRGLSHESIDSLIGDGLIEGTNYLVFESRDGRSLRELINERGRLSLGECRSILLDVLRGLEYLHSKHVIHRDLKPDNIYINSEGRAKLTDFSVAKELSGSQQSDSSPVTQPGVIVGTARYMAPEQWMGERHEDERTDLYAVGLVLYEVLTGQEVFQGNSVTELARAHLSSEPPSLLASRPDLPRELEAVYRRLLAKSQQERFQTAREARNEFEKATQGVPSQLPDLSQDSAPAPELRSTSITGSKTHVGRATPLLAQGPPTEPRINQDLGLATTKASDSLNPQTFPLCMNCGTPQRKPGAAFCFNCGASLSTMVAPQIAPTLQPADDGAPALPAEQITVEPTTIIPEDDGMQWDDLNTARVFGERVQPPSTLAPAPPGAERPGPRGGPGHASIPDVLNPNVTRVGRRIPVFPIGTVLSNKYEVKAHLGQGGTANIYLVVDKENYLQEEIAVKVASIYDDPDRLEGELKSHFKIWGALSNKEPDLVVRLLHVQRIQTPEVETIGVFMEFMAGGSLHRLVDEKWNGAPRTREQLAELMGLFLQACKALHRLHEAKLLHCDIKPANLLLDVTGTKCKLSDFDLMVVNEKREKDPRWRGGTLQFMAPECFEARYSVASEIFAVGVTLYYLLSGTLPFGSEAYVLRKSPPDLSELNPLVAPELKQIIMRCLEDKPEHRPQSVSDLLDDLAHIGLTSEEANTAPVNLARLLLTHLNDDDKAFLAESLEQQGLRSFRKEAEHKQADLIQEYCYMFSPHSVLADNCTGRQLTALARAVGLEVNAAGREELIAGILEAVGFKPGPREIPGVDSAQSFLEGQLLDLAHATTSDESSGKIQSGLNAVERTVDLLVRFYGQLFYGSGFNAFLSHLADGKPSDRLTFGQKVKALRELCTKRPALPLLDRVRQAFEWPIIPSPLFDRLEELVKHRNLLAHQIERGTFNDSKRFGRQVLSLAVEVVAELARNRFIPRVVQIVSRQDDIYGRHFYLGRDDRGHSERIFTPLPLNVGKLYLFYPLTNPVRINPLIFPYDTPKQDEAAEGRKRSNAKESR